MHKSTLVITALIALLLFSIGHVAYGWIASCSTTWNGSGWDECIDGAIEVTGGDATLSVSAPFCFGTGSRWATCGVPGGGTIARVDCPRAYGDPARMDKCCQTKLWEAQEGWNYWVRTYNTSTSQACGPTTGTIRSGIWYCGQTGPGN